jgi:hypothetical protein
MLYFRAQHLTLARDIYSTRRKRIVSAFVIKPRRGHKAETTLVSEAVRLLAYRALTCREADRRRTLP